MSTPRKTTARKATPEKEPAETPADDIFPEDPATEQAAADGEPAKDTAGDPGEETPGHVTSVDGDTVIITPIDPADTPVLARRLLDAADDPAQVATVTSPSGWRVPASVATTAGLA
ncbi:hypothetical protein B842_03345 [Corynebacterium humireducens NBRC 106098 = DSM 45392]|uniref:Uncharacterized protein n=1 Tax=Corynebacterium humireducens NBRC 106098 = DSM 45392 TaxID=1223515 RepID=A0A0B5D5Y8_9CORY|nr:hypothetical protein [Corynebacterium humireducens]AJE32522.1 hypothetical protein B842_03345 [Corynebacterium humireducens NBRC 106098 = DSM 45392]